MPSDRVSGSLTQRLKPTVYDSQQNRGEILGEARTETWRVETLRLSHETVEFAEMGEGLLCEGTVFLQDFCDFFAQRRYVFGFRAEVEKGLCCSHGGRMDGGKGEDQETVCELIGQTVALVCLIHHPL